MTRAQQAKVPWFGLGLAVRGIPSGLYETLVEHWEKGRARAQAEGADPVYMGTTPGGEQASLLLADEALNWSILTRLQPTVEEWYGDPLVGSAAHGLRIYQRGAYLHNHVDRIETHIISCTLCIDAQLADDWPL